MTKTTTAASSQPEAPITLPVFDVEMAAVDVASDDVDATDPSLPVHDVEAVPVPADAVSSEIDAVPTALPAEEEDKGAQVVIAPTAPAAGRFVQHVGTWLMIAMAARLGLYERAETLRDGRLRRAATLRIALDAVIAALAIGQRCVEGVRRLATTSAPVLLRAARAPSATWVRRVLGLFAMDAAGARLHLGMAGAYLAAARDEAGQAPIVFYVDNHMRPYTGQQVVRRGWRMQDKRVTPGASDYYVHDEDGRPVLRIDVPSNASLTSVLTPIARLLRLALGTEAKILLAFDRAGAFPAQMAELREEGFDFVTYERRPFPLLAATAFTEQIQLDDETIGMCDARTNLGKGRGRVRRIALRMADGRQVNLLAVSAQPAA